MSGPSLPTGTVTFLFTDIEGSTRLVERLGVADWTPLLEAHQTIIREALGAESGQEIKTEGDSFFAAFASATHAVAAAARAQRQLGAQAWPAGAEIKVRMGLHTGEGLLSPGADYVGLDVHRAARIAAAGHGGQVLLSATTRALTQAALPAGVTLRDLGEHRLKDLSRSERIAELVIDGLPRDHPPLRTLDATPNNLPVQLTSFIGREREVAAASTLLQGARLLTLTGPGGTGKTRLALQVAAEAIERFPDGVYFVALESVDRPELVAVAIAAVLGLPDTGARPLLERLGEALRPRRTLLVLDNFEQVLQAGLDVAALLRAAPQLTVLITSRGPLRISGEQEFPVPALTLPDPTHLPPAAALSQFEAVALFIQRATSVQPSFQVTNENAPAVAEITARLDGLPLAIELAAARVRLLTPDQMLARLQSRLDLLSAGARDLPDRQRTLRGAIAWSWDLLEEPSRALLARLSVFSGGAPLDAIGPVCDPDASLGIEILDGLEALADHSLLRQADRGEVRFVMLETIRDFASERLLEAGSASGLRERHARWYLALAQQAAPELLGPHGKRWLDRLEVEHDNLRTATAWAVEVGAVEVALELVGSLWRFWQIRGHLAEGAEEARRALALPGWERFPAARLRALDGAAGIAYWQTDMGAARELYGHSLVLLRAEGDSRAIAEGLYNLAMVQEWDAILDTPTRQVHLDAAQAMAEESLEGFRAAGDRGGEGRALWALGNLALDRQDHALAHRHAEAALELFRAAGDTFMVGYGLYLRGANALLSGDAVTARVALTEALSIFAQFDDVTAAVLLIDAFSWLAWQDGEPDRAVRLAGFVDVLESSSGTRLGSLNRVRQTQFRLGDALADPALAAAYAEGRGLSRSEAVALALAPASPASVTAPA